MRIVVVGAPEYLARKGEPGAPEDLAEHDCIIDANFRGPNRWSFGPAGAERTAAVRGRIRYSNAEACLAAAEAGLGLACVPAFVAGHALRSGRVVRLLAGFEAAPYGVHALYPHSRHLAAKVRVLVDFPTERYRGSPDWEEGWA